MNINWLGMDWGQNHPNQLALACCYRIQLVLSSVLSWAKGLSSSDTLTWALHPHTDSHYSLHLNLDSSTLSSTCSLFWKSVPCLNPLSSFLCHFFWFCSYLCPPHHYVCRIFGCIFLCLFLHAWVCSLVSSTQVKVPQMAVALHQTLCVHSGRCLLRWSKVCLDNSQSLQSAAITANLYNSSCSYSFPLYTEPCTGSVLLLNTKRFHFCLKDF